MIKLWVKFTKWRKKMNALKVYIGCYIDSDEAGILDKDGKCCGRNDVDFGKFPCRECRFWKEYGEK